MFKWDEYQNLRVPSRPPTELRHAHVEQLLAQLQAISPETMSLKILGKSYEGRPITCATLGKGPHRILAWSQMHGNEPTHTAALLDLIRFLQCDQQHDTAHAIHEGSTVSLVLMLNPDGAERYQRRNAQDLDINRDAMHLASPEGRILHELVESIRPHFALNLHNQNPRTAVGVQRPTPAAVSLLVPPIDDADTQTEATQQAKQLASVFLNAVKPHCPEMISRYDADFMPRCFGEWVQQQGVATLTVEAGGWTGIDSTPLVRLHFFGLIHLFEAIATNSYLHADSADYDALPRSSEHYLFDLMITGVRVVNGDLQESFIADLGINVTGDAPCGTSGPGGKIEDMGDLHVTTGKRNIAGEGLLCLPGWIDRESQDSRGFLPSATESPQSFAKYSQQNQQAAKELGIPGGGRIQLGAPADLILLKSPSVLDAQTMIDWNDLQHVIVAGRVVFDGDNCQNEAAGKLLKNIAVRR